MCLCTLKHTQVQTGLDIWSQLGFWHTKHLMVHRELSHDLGMFPQVSRVGLLTPPQPSLSSALCFPCDSFLLLSLLRVPPSLQSTGSHKHHRHFWSLGAGERQRVHTAELCALGYQAGISTAQTALGLFHGSIHKPVPSLTGLVLLTHHSPHSPPIYLLQSSGRLWVVAQAPVCTTVGLKMQWSARQWWHTP